VLIKPKKAQALADMRLVNKPFVVIIQSSIILLIIRSSNYNIYFPHPHIVKLIEAGVVYDVTMLI